MNDRTSLSLWNRSNSNRIRVALILLLSILPACNVAPKRGWNIEPRKRAGALLTTGSEADLKREYGDRNVQPAMIQLGEGATAPGSILFPSDSLRRLEIVWQDSTERAIPTRIILRGNRSVWTLPQGVTLGMTLHDLERINRKPLTLAGFGWDYEGIVIDWADGVLDTSLTTDVKVYLRPRADQHGSAEYAQLLGDKPYPSSLPPMQALNPSVYQILVDFEHAPSPGLSTKSPKLEIREEDAGQQFAYDVKTRFTIILDDRKHPQKHLTVSPEGFIGRFSNAPEVAPPLYAVMFEAVKPGRCVVRSNDFQVTIDVNPAP